MIILVVYVLMMTMASGSVNIIISLLFLEALSWLFIQLLPSWSVLKYLFVQSMFFVLFILGSAWATFVLPVSFLVKIGLPPFHLWFIRLLSELKLSPVLFIMTIHKIFPLLLMSKLVSNSGFAMITVLVTSLVTKALMSSMSSTLLVLSVSSMLHNLWMALSATLALSLFIFYWAIYSALVIFLLKSMNISYLTLINSLNQLTLTSLVWLIMSGLPPFALFWLKAYVAISIVVSMGAMLSLMILLGSIAALSAYFRTWHFSGLHVKLALSSSLSLLVAVISMLTLYLVKQ